MPDNTESHVLTEEQNEAIHNEAYEQINVHHVYDKIAAHFSSTRYKPWPVIDDFLRELSPGAIGLDIGCGNGKYLTIRDDVFIVASDRSKELIKYAAQHPPHSAVVADILRLPHLTKSFDFAICIAVIHHLSTPERRIAAIRSVLQSLRCSTKSATAGRALFFVWALEQKNSRRGWDISDEQDQMVPWVLKKGKGTNDKPVTYHRYYHLYKNGELEHDIIAAGGEILQSGYDKDNWWSIARTLA